MRNRPRSAARCSDKRDLRGEHRGPQTPRVCIMYIHLYRILVRSIIDHPAVFGRVWSCNTLPALSVNIYVGRRTFEFSTRLCRLPSLQGTLILNCLLIDLARTFEYSVGGVARTRGPWMRFIRDQHEIQICSRHGKSCGYRASEIARDSVAALTSRVVEEFCMNTWKWQVIYLSDSH